MNNLEVPGVDNLVLSASGKKVKKGQVSEGINAPEVGYDEIVFGEKIGGGCFGNVYKGKCRGKEVAIKRLHKQNLESKTLEEFRKEVDIMTAMRHPNVVLFMGACTEPGKLAIVCEMMEDNVQNLLRRIPGISLNKRVKLAKDTAAGMAWLHGANPQILHRDLKPANLLVDSNWNVKVCDFGLSQVKLREEKLRDGKSVPGTPLWMAPEVLMGKEVTEKADVYSFGIVLWEIVTGQEPFPHMDSYPTFKRAITRNHERPPIPENTHSSLKSLMESCWNPDPSKRPSFKQILEILDFVLIDCLIDDPVGNQFWKDKFPSQESVPWANFQKEFSKLLGVPPPDSEDIYWQCLKKILAEEAKGPNKIDEFVVGLEKFAHICNWFGPIKIDITFNILHQIYELMQREWFHGDIDKDTSEQLLGSNSHKAGTFLVRTSKTDPHQPFTISKVNKKNQIVHQRISKKPDGSLSIKVHKSDKKFQHYECAGLKKDDNLATFIDKALAKPLHLKTPCPGSKYRYLFLSIRAHGYLANDSEED